MEQSGNVEPFIEDSQGPRNSGVFVTVATHNMKNVTLLLGMTEDACTNQFKALTFGFGVPAYSI